MGEWKIKYSEYKPEEEMLREALCTLGNGFFATRGAAEECQSAKHHYPGTYLAGGYNRLETEIAGKVIENEDLVNWPDWTVLKLKIESGKWFNPDSARILNYEQELDMKKGILLRRIRFEDENQRETELVTRRIVSMCNKHICAIQWELSPVNWSGKIVLHTALDGSVINNGVKRYRELKSKHLKVLEKGNLKDNAIYLKAMASQSEITMAQAARTKVFFDSYDSSIIRENVEQEEYIAQELTFDARENKKITVEKVISLFSSRDPAISEPLVEAKKVICRAGDFKELLKEHTSVWENIWQHSDIMLKADNTEDQLLLRFHIFHLYQTYSLNSVDYDTGIPARGWHGEAYRGHIFWDEIFILPLFNISTPEISRSVLMYRYRRLPEAREAAKKAGYEGVMFPWQSGSNGREESQVIHLNPESGNWIPDNTHLQRHVNGAIAYNIWQYFETTGNLEFLAFYGVEMLIDISKFWASKTVFNAETQKYEIHEVVGPDEYHTRYPDSDELGLRNNAYTNVMAVWTMVHTLEAMEKLDERRVGDIMRHLELTNEDMARWDKISRNMYIPFMKDGKIIEQFEGFEDLKDLDWEKYHKKYGEILRLDRIMEKEDDEVNRYKATKQADVLMLFYLFSAEELTRLFERMGYTFNPKEQIPANINYYQKITSHGSTLSKLVHSWVFARLHRDKSWHNFKTALISDFEDVQGGTTHEGIHLGAMAGTIDLIQRCYTGIEFKKNCLHFNPQLPENVKEIKFRLRYMSHWLDVTLTAEDLKLKSYGGWEEKINVIVNENTFSLEKGQEMTIDYQK